MVYKEQWLLKHLLACSSSTFMKAFSNVTFQKYINGNINVIVVKFTTHAEKLPV